MNLKEEFERVSREYEVPPTLLFILLCAEIDKQRAAKVAEPKPEGETDD